MELPRANDSSLVDIQHWFRGKRGISRQNQKFSIYFDDDCLILTILLHESRWLARAAISWYTSYWCQMQISMGIDLTRNGSSNLVVTWSCYDVKYKHRKPYRIRRKMSPIHPPLPTTTHHIFDNYPPLPITTHHYRPLPTTTNFIFFVFLFLFLFCFISYYPSTN